MAETVHLDMTPSTSASLLVIRLHMFTSVTNVESSVHNDATKLQDDSRFSPKKRDVKERHVQFGPVTPRYVSVDVNLACRECFVNQSFR